MFKHLKIYNSNNWLIRNIKLFLISVFRVSRILNVLIEIKKKYLHKISHHFKNNFFYSFWFLSMYKLYACDISRTSIKSFLGIEIIRIININDNKILAGTHCNPICYLSFASCKNISICFWNIKLHKSKLKSKQFN
jgi:hypothetical protein